ncbi:MAG: ATP-binding cassette domain-containing protein [Candidatus Methanomethylicaceae archaeon]|jgi:ABC-type sugar transport system ATPase subunit
MLLQLFNVDLTLGTFKLDSVTLNVDQQEYLIIIGRTASGKTTLLKTIAGAYRPSSGKILIDGSDITTAPPEKRNVAYVSQIFSSFDPMNVQGNIEFGLRARGVPKPERAQLMNGIVRDLGIEHLLDRMPATLSGGEQQRVSLARALVTSPKILLLDEPLSMIDPETKGPIIRLLKAIPEKYNIPVVHVTHEWDEAYALAGLIAVMHQGRIIEAGDPEQIFNEPRNYHTAKLAGFYDMHKGVATLTDSGSTIKLDNGLELKSRMKISGSVYACVRPEGVKIRTSNEFNNFEGRIVEVFREKFGFRIIININNIEFTALAGSKPTRGDIVKVTIPEDSVYVVPNTGI